MPRKSPLMPAGAFALLFIFGLSVDAYSQSTLTVAMKAQPPTLDLHVTSTNTVRNVGAHINEGLFAFDANFQPAPMLAKSYTVSSDGLIYTLELRPEVYFHNGDRLEPADVVASLNRWLERSAFGRTLDRFVEDVRPLDGNAVEIRLNTPVSFLTMALSTWRAGPFIYPEETIEAAGDGRINEPIGTGPFRFVQWREGQEILLERFADYASPQSPANGYAGQRSPLVDILRFVFVPELSVRRIGVETGDFDVALDIDADSFSRYESNNAVISSLGAPRMTTVIPNKSSGLMATIELRRAVQSAICVEEILPIYGHERFWRVDPSLTWKETAWWSEAGKERYNVCDPDLAQDLAESAGYSGKPIRLALSSEDESKLNVGLVLQQQLERAGFTVTLEVRDAAAHEETLDTKSAWDLAISEHTYRTHPILHSHLQATWTGWWENSARDSLVAQLLSAPDASANSVWDQIQALYYEDAAIIKIGDYFEHHIARSSVRGYANMPEPFFWNVSIE